MFALTSSMTYFICPRTDMRRGIYSLYSQVKTGMCRDPLSGEVYLFTGKNRDSSFIAGMLQFRYVYAMPVERILGYFSENGFELCQPTAHGLINFFYENIRWRVGVAAAAYFSFRFLITTAVL